MDGTHRVTSLKCGHLFGSSCIEKWLKQRNCCPTCSAACRKTHLRPIYAARVEATDTDKEREAIDKFIRETEARKALEQEVASLKAQIEILRSGQITRQVPVQISSKLHTSFLRYCKIHFFPDDSLVTFEPINQSLVVSCYKNGLFGVYKYSVSDFGVNSFIKTDEVVRSLQASPFNDGLCLIAYGQTVSLLNIYSECVVRTLSFATQVSAVSFSYLNRDLIFVGDMLGCLHTCNLETRHIDTQRACSENIHSIAESVDVLCVASVFGVYTRSNDVKRGPSPFVRVETDATGICTSVTSDGKNILAVLRHSDCSITCILLGDKHIVFTPDVKQVNRHRDKIFNGYVMLSDDFRNTIKVLDLNTLNMVYSYAFKEPAVDFCGDSKILMALTRRGVYMYHSD